MKNPNGQRLRACVANLAKNPNALPNVVTIPLRPGECREQRADDLRQWCAANCVEEWRPMERWTEDAVRIAFGSDGDAVRFQLSV